MRATNRSFENLSRLGTFNGRNRFTVRTAESNEIGVAVTQPGSKKATTLEIVVPAERSYLGSRRAGRLVLNGHQMRELYETLRAAYETGVINNG
jgi:hypothetical protein